MEIHDSISEQQIAHMKAKGITFDLVSEGEAAAHLREKCQFFCVYAYRKLWYHAPLLHANRR